MGLAAVLVLSIRLARQPETQPPDALAYGIGIVIGALTLFRRRWPLGVLQATAATLQAYYLMDYPGISAALPLSVSLPSAAAQGHMRWAIGIAAWYTFTPLLFLILVEDLPALQVLQSGAEEGALLGAVLLLGEAIRSRRALDREHTLLEIERERSERLLLNVLPPSIAARLKESDEPIADRYAEVAVLFADIVDFTRRAAMLPAEAIVASLDDVFSSFDRLARELHLEKIKTIGDAYMVAGGAPEPRQGCLEAVADMALAMLDVTSGRRGPDGDPIRLRIGIDAGPVVAGVIGREKFSWDLWGDTVNTASRMESTGVPGRIQTTARVHERLRHRYDFEERGPVAVRGKGELVTYFLLGRRSPP